MLAQSKKIIVIILTITFLLNPASLDVIYTYSAQRDGVDENTALLALCRTDVIARVLVTGDIDREDIFNPTFKYKENAYIGSNSFNISIFDIIKYKFRQLLLLIAILAVAFLNTGCGGGIGGTAVHSVGTPISTTNTQEYITIETPIGPITLQLPQASYYLDNTEREGIYYSYGIIVADNNAKFTETELSDVCKYLNTIPINFRNQIKYIATISVRDIISNDYTGFAYSPKGVVVIIVDDTQPSARRFYSTEDLSHTEDISKKAIAANGTGSLLRLLSHEIAHLVFNLFLSDGIKNEFIEYYLQSSDDKDNFVTNYAMTSAEEDFCETVARYFYYSQALWEDSIERVSHGKPLLLKKTLLLFEAGIFDNGGPAQYAPIYEINRRLIDKNITQETLNIYDNLPIIHQDGSIIKIGPYDISEILSEPASKSLSCRQAGVLEWSI